MGASPHLPQGLSNKFSKEETMGYHTAAKGYTC